MSRYVAVAVVLIVSGAVTIGCVPNEEPASGVDATDVGAGQYDASAEDVGPDAGGADDSGATNLDAADAADADADVAFEWGNDPEGTCNGARHLCERRVDQVVYVTTHNAYSTTEDRFVGPNQTHSMRRQLVDGVRGMMLDIYDNGAFDASLCHSNCVFGERDLVAGLSDIAEFLEARPSNVVTLILESYVSAETFEAALVEAGLQDRVWVPDGAELPTLRQLIDAGTQLILLTDREAGGFPGYLDVWAWAWDTDWQNSSTDDFDCARRRGDVDNPLFILNHFLGDPLSNRTLAEQANSNPFFRERVRQCADEAGQLPNYVTVDFYEIGDVFEVVDELNAP